MTASNKAIPSKGGMFAGAADTDRPALAATLMVGALALLGLQDSLVKLISGEVSLWQFQLLRSACNLAMIIVIARFYGGGSLPFPKRVGAVVLRSLLMVGAMIVLGGATRLTNSGLSITEWAPIKGALPPLNAESWLSEFKKYQQIPRKNSPKNSQANFENTPAKKKSQKNSHVNPKRN